MRSIRSKSEHRLPAREIAVMSITVAVMLAVSALVEGGMVKRSEWEGKTEGGNSVFQRAMQVVNRNAAHRYSTIRVKRLRDNYKNH